MPVDGSSLTARRVQALLDSKVLFNALITLLETGGPMNEASRVNWIATAQAFNAGVDKLTDPE